MLGVRMAAWGCLVLLLAAEGCGEALESQDRELATRLAQVYDRWSRAGGDGDLVAWKRTSSASSYKKLINGLISMKQQLSSDKLRQLARAHPVLDDYELAGTRQAGDTAIAVYHGGKGGQRQHFLLLDFVQEEGDWKFHWISMRDDMQDAEARWAKRDLTFLDETGFKPLGRVPAVPLDCPRPDFVAYLKIDSLGYETRVKMHGFDFPPILDNTLETLITGGLVSGENRMELSMRPIATGGIKAFRVAVSVLIEQDGSRTVDERFVYEPEEVPSSHTWFMTMP